MKLNVLSTPSSCTHTPSQLFFSINPGPNTILYVQNAPGEDEAYLIQILFLVSIVFDPIRILKKQ